jgi:hypothetical protein
MREGLSASKLRVGWPDGTSCGEHGAVTLKQRESYALICEPPQRGERHHTVATDYDQAAKAVPNARKSCLMTFGTDPVLKYKVGAIYANLDSVAEKRHDTVTGRQ